MSSPSGRLVFGLAFVGHAIAAMAYALLDWNETLRGAIYFSSKIVVNAIPLLWFVVFDAPDCDFLVKLKRLFQLKLPTRRSLLVGVATGLFMGLFILAFYYVALRGRLDVDGLREKASAFGLVTYFFWLAAFVCLINSGLEEYYWRWFMFGVIRRSMSIPIAAALSALSFTLHHILLLAAYFPSAGLVVVLNLGVFAGGLIWATIYHRCGNIIVPWVSHALVDVAIMVVAYDLLFMG